MKYILEFKTPEDWRPLSDGCIQECPLNTMLLYGDRCMAKEMFDDCGEIRCPMIKGLTRIEKSFNQNSHIKLDANEINKIVASKLNEKEWEV